MATKNETKKDQNSEQKDEVQQNAQNQTDAKEGKASGSEKSEQQGKADSKNEKAKTVTLTLRHKSHTPHYHRCGLTLTKTFAEYEVFEESAERLKADKWVEVKK